MTQHFKARPIASDAVAEARARHAAGDRDVARVVVATPLSSPCRHCLRDGEPGEAMLLFRYVSVDEGPYAESGPVFAHEAPCERAVESVDALPEMTAARALVVVRAYDGRDWIHSARLVAGPEAADALTQMFANADIAYAHVRSATNGCFTYRVERAA